MSLLDSPADTWSGNYDATSITVTICSGISLYNVLELGILIYLNFSLRQGGLYLWSLSVSVFAIILYNVGFLIEYFRLTSSAAGKTLDGLGWMGMVTGQALVLYSRLGLILHNPLILKAIKYMIIWNALTLHPMTEVFNFGANFGSNRAPFAKGYIYVEKIQMTIFCVQEFILSGIYLWQTVKLLKVIQRNNARKTMWQLFIINAIIIILDVGLLVVEFNNYRVIEQTVKGFVYSVKLKMEFAILGKLVELVHSTQRSLSAAFAGGEAFSNNNNNDIKNKEHHQSQHLEHVDTADPRPIWLRDLDKMTSSADHIEYAQYGKHGSISKGAAVAAADAIEHIDSSRPAPLPSQAHHRARHANDESDLLYAEAVRSISY